MFSKINTYYRISQRWICSPEHNKLINKRILQCVNSHLNANYVFFYPQNKSTQIKTSFFSPQNILLYVYFELVLSTPSMKIWIQIFIRELYLNISESEKSHTIFSQKCQRVLKNQNIVVINDIESHTAETSWIEQFLF